MNQGSASTASFGRGIATQIAVFKALLLREMNSRFGRDNIGILWMIGEPMLLASAITTVHFIKGGSNDHGSIQPGMFTLVGYTCFIIFRGLFNRAGGIVDSNVNLLYHRQISLFDLITVRTVIEVAGCFGAYFVLTCVFYMIGIGDFPYRPLYLFAGYGLMAWLSTAAAMVVAHVTFNRPTLERMTHMFSYFMMPFSGAFFMVEWLPTDYQRIIVWNPLTVIFEITRYGQFETASNEFIDFGYVLTVNGCLTYIGLLLLRRLRRKIHLT